MHLHSARVKNDERESCVECCTDITGGAFATFGAEKRIQLQLTYLTERLNCISGFYLSTFPPQFFDKGLQHVFKTAGSVYNPPSVC